MSEIAESLEKIREKIFAFEQEIKELRKMYLSLVKPCQNKDCEFFDERRQHHCSWTLYVEICPQYKTK